MLQIATVGLGLVKNVFMLHGADTPGLAVLCRGRVFEFSGDLPSCTVAMEACGGAHHRGRDREAGPRGPADPAGLCKTVRAAG